MWKKVLALVLPLFVVVLLAWIRHERAEVLANAALNSVRNVEVFQDADDSTFGIADLKARERIDRLSAYLQRVHLPDTSPCVFKYLHEVEMNRMIFVSGASEDIRTAQPLPEGYYADRAQSCLRLGRKS